VGAAA